MLADDTSGDGHTSRVVGNEPHIFMPCRWRNSRPA
jgi:hypothetical protein